MSRLVGGEKERKEGRKGYTFLSLCPLPHLSLNSAGRCVSVTYSNTRRDSFAAVWISRSRRGPS